MGVLALYRSLTECQVGPAVRRIKRPDADLIEEGVSLSMELIDRVLDPLAFVTKPLLDERQYLYRLLEELSCGHLLETSALIKRPLLALLPIRRCLVV